MTFHLSNAHTGWSCDNGATLIIEATSPGPGTLPRLHGVIYACDRHQESAQERIAAAEYTPNACTAPLSHRWNPWPCGHTTAYDEQVAPLLGTAPVVPPPTVTY